MVSSRKRGRKEMNKCEHYDRMAYLGVPCPLVEENKRLRRVVEAARKVCYCLVSNKEKGDSVLPPDRIDVMRLADALAKLDEAEGRK